jgi:hypothetical protein
MTYLLASIPLKLREIAPIEFVPIAALLILLVEREIIRARPGQWRRRQQRTVTHVLNLAVFPLMVLFLLLVGLRAYTSLG